jgi:hypothetical protein
VDGQQVGCIWQVGLKTINTIVIFGFIVQIGQQFGFGSV